MEEPLVSSILRTLELSLVHTAQPIYTDTLVPSLILVLLLFMHLLVVDLIIENLFCRMFQGVKRIDYNDLRIYVRASGQNHHVGNILLLF